METNKTADIKQYRQQYYAKNKKKLLAYTKKWMTTNKDKVASYRKEYYKKHRYKLGLVAERFSLRRTLANAEKKIVTVKARLVAIENQLRTTAPKTAKVRAVKPATPRITKARVSKPKAEVVVTPPVVITEAPVTVAQPELATA